MITAAAQAQVITAVKRSPAGPQANEQYSSFHLCTGGLCHLQIAGEIRFSFPPDGQPKAGQLMPFIGGWAEFWGGFLCVSVFVMWGIKQKKLTYLGKYY